jgi:hypothetical protein
MISVSHKAAGNSRFYRWKQKYEKEGRFGLYRERLTSSSHPRRTSPEVVEKILAIRTEYQFGASRISTIRTDAYMSFKLVFTDMSKTSECGMCTSNPKHLN